MTEFDPRIIDLKLLFCRFLTLIFFDFRNRNMLLILDDRILFIAAIDFDLVDHKHVCENRLFVSCFYSLTFW